MTKHRIYASLTLLLALIAAAAAQAQARPDSLALRLQRAEAAIETLQRQLAEQSEQGVKARSGMHVEFVGRVMMNGFWNDRRVNNVDNPQFVKPDTAVANFPGRGAGMAIRQTRLGLDVRGAEIWGGKFAGDVDVDFYGGQQASSGGRTFPLLRLRTARGFLRWSNAELMIGQDQPLISGVNPVSPTAIGTPGFATAGNLWLWLPQLRLTLSSGGSFRVGVQGAALAPTSGDPANSFDTDNDVAERSGRPYIQGRVFVKWGEDEMRGEIGCGLHLGWLAPTTSSAIENTDAYACDAIAPIAWWLEMRGEAFTGSALKGLGGGGIGQSLTAGNAPIDTRGFWGQVNLRPDPGLHLGAGCGSDQPDPVALRHRNDACAGYMTIRPPGPVFIGMEYRRIRTMYAAASFISDHVTLGLGFEF